MGAEQVTVLPGVTQPYRWLIDPTDASLGEGEAQIATGGPADWFVDPASGEAMFNAPAVVWPLEGDFTLEARVRVDFASTFDAGALVVFHDEARWAKLAFEMSPQGQAMVVSVVTRGHSDDCNSRVVDADAVWLRVARRGPAHAFHASLDGRRWEFVRHFRLGEGVGEVGLEVQSPRGAGCRAAFSELAWRPGTLTDLRSGV
jgi:regulation of enolase protein 1 (concanavalin A-like superfamily)